MATQAKTNEGQLAQRDGQVIKRRGLIAGAAVLAAGILAKQTAEPVGATSGGGGQGALILGSNPFGTPAGPGNTANVSSVATVLQATPNFGNYTGYGASVFAADASPAVSGDITGLVGTGRGAGTGVYGVAGLPNGVGVIGTGVTGTGPGVLGFGGSGGAPGIQGFSTADSWGGVDGVATVGNADGVRGFAHGTAGAGVRGTGYSGTGVVGATTGGTVAMGVYGLATGGYGVYGQATASNGYGVTGVSTDAFGVNGASTSGIGVRGFSTSGAGVRGQSSSGVGVYGTSTGNYGVLGVSTAAGFAGCTGISSSANIPAFAGGNSAANGLAAVFNGVVAVNGNFVVSGGSKSAAVPFADGSHRLVYCTESPESWFEDFGEAKLVGGKADVKLDADFVQIVHADTYHIFLTPSGDHKGLYVTGKTAAGFAVRESQNGASNLSFSYRIVAKRKDIAGERLAKFAVPNVKFAEVPADAAPKTGAPPAMPEIAPPTPPALPAALGAKKP